MVKSSTRVSVSCGMMEVSSKKETKRIAKAQAVVKLKSDTLKFINNRTVAKGDVLEAARLAGIMAVKNTPNIIPLCHPLRIAGAEVSFFFIKNGIKIISRVSAVERTGVEMEALAACSVAALTIYDMCKMYDKAIEITDIFLLEKKGGRTGDFKRRI